MKQTTALLGLACKAVTLLILIVRLYSAIEHLAGGAANYLCSKIIATNSRPMAVA